MTQDERRKYMISALLCEHSGRDRIAAPSAPDEQRRLLRALMNVRPPRPISADFLKVQDEYLRERLAERKVTDAAALDEIQPHICLWQGDITTLKCDAIVNAANSAMLGCFCPNHSCIDNAIHTFAGVQLRLKCAEIMAHQGAAEPVGRAKITPAYNLPSRYVLHTVGPYVEGLTTARDKEALASCYRSCLELAAANGLESVAFCCISTGEFHFPNAQAAKIAVATVREFLTAPTSVKRVIFNVFKATDREIYARQLG